MTTINSTLSVVPEAGASKVPCDCFGGYVGFPGPDLIAATEGVDLYRDEHQAEFEPGGPYASRSLKKRSGTVVSVCRIATNECERVVIPAPRKRFLDAWVDDGPRELQVSPDGKFLAVAVQITRWWFDTQRAEWGELHVFQVAPFREIGKIGPRRGCSPGGFAVGDADGKAHVAADWCGKWVVETIANSVAASHE